MDLLILFFPLAGTSIWEEEPQLRRSPWKEGGPTATTIRKLLCDNANCVLCAHAAREAENLVHIQRLNPENLVLRKPSLPTTSYVERSSLPAISGLQDNPVFSRSRSEPPPRVGHLRHSPGASPSLRKRQHLPKDVIQRTKPLPSNLPETVTFPKHVRHLSRPHRQVPSKRKNNFNTIDEQKDEEVEPSSSSSMSEPPCTKRAESGPFPDVSTVYSQKDHTLWGHQKTFHHHEDDGSSSEKDTSSHSEAEDEVGTPLLSEEEQDFLTASLTSAGSSSSRKMIFVAIDLPFVSETVLEKLEQHLVVKRMQNAIGLPVILLRSLKTFLPFAPSPIIRWSLKREVVVVTRPQVLPFKSVATRRRLEQHVKKRAHLKHWALPRKIQEVLRHMKTDVHRTVPREEGSGGEKSPSSIKPPHLASTSRDATLDYPLHSKPRFQVHIGKKLFQIAHETFPKRVEMSQKISASEEKKIVLPKLISLHWRNPQARGGPSLGLRRKADSVEMNIKRKHIQYLWHLPTFYSQSLSKMAPMTFNLPVTPPQVFHPSEFSHAVTPFLPTSQRQLLDLHVLRKKVQHQWGQPKLVQQSLRQFLSGAPPVAPVSPAIPKGPQVDIMVAPRSTLPFVPLETNKKLDDHIKRKIIERQWGVPQRVMKSLQMFMPMPPSVVKIARESEKEKVAKRSPSVKDPGPCKLPQVLQKHVGQKALEIHLGGNGPFSMLRQTAALRDREDALPRLISPGSRTLQLRSKELLFMEQTALEHVELSVRHKDLAHKWGLPTLYQKSLSHLFTGVEFQVPPPPLSRRPLGLEFSSSDIAFISQGAQEDLEWHVRRKRMQHMWGLASLVQKSLKLFLPPAPHWHAAGHTEVTTLPAEITFLGDSSIHELERNVQKRVVLQRWLLPRRLLEPMKMLGSRLAVVSGPSQEMKKPRRASVSSPRQPEVFHLPPRGKALKEMGTRLEKKHLEILLGVMPSVVRFSWQHATFTPRQPLPKLIPPGHSFLQPRCRFLPFERPEDVAQIEQNLKHKWLMFLWGLSIQYLEALGGMMPKPPGRPVQTRLADCLVFSEVKVLFLQENIREAFEGHIHRKRLQHEWGLPDMIQRSLRGFMEGAPSQVSPQNVTEVQVLHKKLTFLPQYSSQFLELHIHRRKHQHQWSLPKRVLESMKGLGVESIAGPQPQEMQVVDQSQVGLEPSEKGVTNGEKASHPPSTGDRSPPETLCFRVEVEKKIQLLFLKKCVEVQMGVFPSVAMQSWQHLSPSRAALPKPASSGSWVPQPRRHFLPFVRAEDAGRLELAILRHRLTSLWSLVRVYVGGIAALQPRLPSSHRRPREEELSTEQTLSLQAEVSEALELHVRKKRLEHGWGFPRLIQKSLQGFMERAPVQPSLQKMGNYAHILYQAPAFLPSSTYTQLESHIQRRYLQRQWRLPAKALESFKLLYPRLELSPSDLRSNEDGDVPPYCCGQGMVSQHPILDLGYLQPGEDMGTASSVEVTPQRAEVLSKIDSKDVNQLQIYLGKKNVEVQLEAIPNIYGLAWTRSSSKQRLPKQIPPGLRIWQPRSSSLPFFSAGEIERIEMAVRCNHLLSLWSLGMHCVDVLSALPFRPFSKPFRLRRISIEFSEAQTSFLQEQERQGLERHVVKKKVHHSWGFPVLVQKSMKAFMQELPIPPIPQRNLIDVRVIHQEPSFLPHVVSSRLEFHVQKMNFQRQWGLPRRALKSFWRPWPTDEDAEGQRPPMLHLDQNWRNFPRGPSLETVSVGWRGGTQSTERDLRTKSDVISALDPQNLRRLQLHLAKKHMEIHYGVLPIIAKTSHQLADLHSKQPLPKMILSGQGLLQPRNISPLTMSPEDRDHLEWMVQRNHFAFLWGMGLRYREALAGMIPKFTSPFPGHRWAQVDFSEMQMFFLQMEDREVLEDHIKKKKIQHMWSSPMLVQRSMERFMSRAPLCHGTHKLETNTRILLHEVHFLPPNTQTHLEHHIQRRKLLQKWGLPKKMHKSLKIFLPRTSVQTPVPPTKELLEGSKKQKGKQTPELLSKVTSSVPSSRPIKQQAFRFQMGETLYLPGKEKEVLEHHIKKKRLQHQWGLPVAIQRSLQAFAPPFLGPVCPSKKAGQDVKIQVQRPLFLPLHSQENLEDSLKRRVIHQQWRLPKKVHDSLQAFSLANPARRQQPYQKKAGPNHIAKKDHLKNHLRRKSEEINFQSRTVPDILLPESLHSERDPRSTTQQPGTPSAINGKGPNQRTSQAEAKDLLEFHILHKKICHEWGLPRIVQKSLSAFCPPLPKPQTHQGSVGESLETVKEDGATTGKNVFQEDEMKLLAESQQVTKEEVSKTPQDSKRDSVSTKATETEKLTLASEMLESSEEINSTGEKPQENKEESRKHLQDTEKDKFTSKSPKQPSKTSPDVGSPQSPTKSTTNPQSPQASEEANITSERPEAINDESPGTLKGTTILSKSLQATEGASEAGLQIADLVTKETPWSVDAKGSSGPGNGGVAFETPQDAEERRVVETTLRGDAAAENGRYSPGTGSLQMEVEGNHGAAEKEGTTAHGLQVGPENIASDSLCATDEFTEELHISSPHSAEEISITSKGSQATEGLVELQITEEVIEMPQATGETVRANRLPQGEEDNENVMSPKSETTRSLASEISLTVEGKRAVATTADGRANDAAVTAAAEESDLPRGQHGEKSQSTKDMSFADGRRPSTTENIMAVNVEANVPDQILPTMEGGASPYIPLEVTHSGSQIPEDIGEANTPDKVAWSKDETNIVVGGSLAPVSGRSPDMNMKVQSPHAKEEKSFNLGQISSGRSSEEEKETSTSGRSSEAASKEATILEDLSGKEEGKTQRGPLLAEEEWGHSELHPQWVTAADRPPVEGEMQDGSVSCQVPSRLSPMAESPPAAERKRMGGKTWAQDGMGHMETPFGGQAPEQTQESFRKFLPQSRFHSYHKSTRVHFLTEAEPDSHSRPQKSSPAYRSEVQLQLEPGGRIGSCVSTEKPSCSTFPKAVPIMEATEGGSSHEIQPEEGKARISSPEGRSSLCDKPELPYVLLQQETPKQDLLTSFEPEDYGSSSSFPPQSSHDKYNASRRDSQTSDSPELSSLEGNAECMPSSSIEQLLWDKESFSQQLERSMQGMVRDSASPSGLRQSGRQPVTCAPYECGTTVCERDVVQKWEEREEAFPMARDAGTRSMASLEDNETQKKTHQAGSIVQGHLPEQENLLKPSEVATNPLLRSHVVQRALGSFIRPACVIFSYSTCDDVEVGLIRQAGREHRQRLSAPLLEEKPVLEKERESSPEQGQGVGGERPLRSAAVYTGEPKDLAHRDFQEPPPPPPSPNLSTTALDQQDHEGSQITGEASIEGPALSNLSGEKFSAVSSLEAGTELPAPPSDWLQSETGAGSEYEDGSSLVIPPHQQSMQQNPMSSEDHSQFSTEREWDRVGDWATEDMNSESLTMEDEEDSHLDPQERPTEGSSLKAEASSRSQARSASSSSRKDKSNGFSIIGSVLERKLSLKKGMNVWQHSQGCRLTTWKEKKRHDVPSEAEEGRAGFSGDLEHALEGDIAERWMVPHPALPSKGETLRQGETHVPQTQTFLTARPGFHHRCDTSTGSFSTHCQASRSSSEDYIQERNWGPQGALARDRTGHKTSALASVARKRRNAKTQSQERAAERGAGGRMWGPSRRKMAVVKRDTDTSGCEESSSSSREERLSNDASGSEGQAAVRAQGAAKTREGGLCRRREEPPRPERTIRQPLPQADQEDKTRQLAAWKSPQSREGSPERDPVRLSPRECQPAGREGSPLEDSPGGCGFSEATAPPGRPSPPLPHGEQFRNLKERILLRRKELWSSPDSEDEHP